MSQTCRVCGRTIQGDGPIGVKSHAGKHLREFKEQFGRKPESYDEVKEHREQLGYTYRPQTEDHQKPVRDSVDRAREFVQRWA